MLKVEVDKSIFDKEISKIKNSHSKAVNSTLKQVAVDTGKKLVVSTGPDGIDGRAKSIMEGATKADVLKAYGSAPVIYNKLKVIHPGVAAGFMKAINSGDVSTAIKISTRYLGQPIMGDSNLAYLKSIRGPNGHTSGPMITVPGTTGQTIKAVNDRIKEARKFAGLVKAGWVSAIRKLDPGYRSSQWIDRNAKNKTGDVNQFGKSITLINKVDYASNVVKPGDVQSAIRFALSKIKFVVK